MTIRTGFFWIAAACCVIAELVILRSLLFGRARAAERGLSDSGPVARTKRPAEIAWALLPAVGLLLVLYLTWRAVEAPATPSSNASRVGATIGV
jgi:heme/copper-type cytochrome/quinol oxidase subunit 2